MLEVKNLSFGVTADGQEKKILHNVDLTVPDGK